MAYGNPMVLPKQPLLIRMSVGNLGYTHAHESIIPSQKIAECLLHHLANSQFIHFGH